MKKILLLILFGSVFPLSIAKQRSIVLPRINSGTNSQVILKSGSKLKNSSSTMNVGQAKINVRTGSVLEGLPVGFVNGGIALKDGAPTTFTGTYIPATSSVSVANSSWRALSGGVEAAVQLSEGASFEGIPNINKPVSIQPGATASVGCQSTFNSDLDLNGGNASLTNNMSFGDGAQIVGDGSVIGNGKSAILGGRDLIVTSSVKWVNADLVVNSRISLYGRWTMSQDIHVLGRGNILDLTHGGKLYIKNNTRVYLANINVKGITPSNIIFEGVNSELVLSSSSLELDANFTLTLGSIYVDSGATIITGDNVFKIDQNGFMTIDGVTLFYDTLDFPDNKNIQPTPDQDPFQDYIEYRNGGVIRSFASLGSSGDYHYSADTALNTFLFIGPGKKLYLDESLTFSGNQNVLYVAADGPDPVMFVADNKTVWFTQLDIRGFSPELLSLGTNAQVMFGENTTVELGKDALLDMSLVFTGKCVLDGQGKTLELGEFGEIVIDRPGSSLLITDITIKSISGTKIRCTDNTCTLSLRDVTWIQDNLFSFDTGRFEIFGRWDLFGMAQFVYQTSGQSKIASNGTMYLSPETIFVYYPSTNNNDLIAMEDPTSTIHLNGASLVSSTTGMRLTKGTLLVNHKNYLYNFGGISVSQGFTWGDGIMADNLFINMMPGASLNLETGCLNNQNTF